MRKLVIVLLVACLLSVLVYSGVGADNYFLLRLGDWAIQMRLVVALLLGIGLLVIVSLCWKAFRGIVLGAWPKAWRKRRRYNKTTAALESVAKSDWLTGQKEFTRLANQSDDPGALVINAAKCARNAGNYEDAKGIYQAALEELPEWSNIIRHELCEIGLIEGDLESVEAHLIELKKTRFPSADILLLDAKLAEERRDWDKLQSMLLKVRKKSKKISPLAAVERRYLFSRIMEKPGTQALLEFARFLSGVRNPPEAVISETARQLAMKGQGQEAETLVRRSLTEMWSEELISVYADMEAQSPRKQLKVAEKWLDQRRDSPALIASLQKLAVRAEDDGKADQYAAMLTSLEEVEIESKQLRSLAAG